MYLIIIAIFLFVIADLLIRYFLKMSADNKTKKERESALETGMQIDFSRESKSLKRVEVKNPNARILCIDDEEVILDSFRKILVLDGYSVDTVDNGMDGLALLQTHHYDFVYTDLKMPEMDGISVTKAVKQIRPDIDVIIITGYGTIESAVETMKYGAMDYVQKPFTEDELLELTRQFLVKRKHRIANELKPKVHITQLSEFSKRDIGEFAIPGGVFISKGHCWVSVNQDGISKIGIDDFARKVIGRIDMIDLPNPGRSISCGQNLFSIRSGGHVIPFMSPLRGKVTKVNSELNENLQNLDLTPYDNIWICMIDAENLSEELKELMIGNTAVAFYQDEIERGVLHIKPYLEELKLKAPHQNGNNYFLGILEKIDDKGGEKMINRFFKRIS